MATRYLFYSHDGFGLGHVRRNTLIGRAVLNLDPAARVSLVTGLAVRPEWMRRTARMSVHHVAPLLKAKDGSYRNTDAPFEVALRERETDFAELVETEQPAVVVVDRHPYGTAGELRRGLELAKKQGAVLVLGLRDVLDEPQVVAEEMGGLGWRDVADIYDDIVVYGRQHFVDHEAEYGLVKRPTYTGWVVEREPSQNVRRNLLVIAAGGGGDGAAVFELGARLLADSPELHGLFAPGPYADMAAVREASDRVAGRSNVTTNSAACGPLFARAEAILCMAGYNSTLEALSTGQRPILMPRRTPRREQAIRASRLAALGLADVVDEGADVAEVAWLLRRPRQLPPNALESAGIDFDGAAHTALRLRELTLARSTR
jgi:predicted glycosyltransferase